MKMIKRNHLYQIAFMPNFFPVNCYLIEEEDSLTLIDAALPYCSDSILKSAGKIGKPLKRILLTHIHDDHVGALDKIKASNPEIEVWVPKREERMMRGDRSLEQGESQKPIRGGVPKNLKTKADFFMSEGDQVGSLTAIETPGHTPGSMSFLDTRDHSLIAGDAFQTRGRTAVSGQMVIAFPFPALATWCKETAAESAEKIQNHNPTLLAVGHGRMLENPSAEIGQAIQSARQALK
ncbi:MBL fold metallo-hydrolase [Bacillus sp. SG-1]|uniref:MBL fold metallo-hydrolase n=1 Tax=Bacillus sp. SG-1 TaxID=161544 RepID=UPI0001543FF9|nr:MBL fold metallo-hydrolase [Bacillus sp. SG-1]EDL64885.1 metallo-beta-lactamase family protein [Bacillus sp. SG-1]